MSAELDSLGDALGRLFERQGDFASDIATFADPTSTAAAAPAK